MTRQTRSDAGFTVYASLGPTRSLDNTHEAIAADPHRYGFTRTPSLRSIENWSRRDRWIERAAEIDQKAREAEEQALVEHAKEHRARLRQEGLLLQQKGVQWLAAKEADDVKAGDAIRAIAEGFRLEALGLGEPTDRVAIEEQLAVPLKELAYDELTRLIDHLRRGAEGGAAGASAT